MTEYNKCKAAHAPLFENPKFLPFFDKKEIQTYLTDLHLHEAMVGVPLTQPPAGAATPAAAPVAEVKAAGPPPETVDAKAHTKHPLLYNDSLKGHSCDVCRQSCTRAYVCKCKHPITFAFHFSTLSDQ
jgi:hypothetical protein